MKIIRTLFLFCITTLVLQSLNAQTGNGNVAFVNGFIFTDAKTGITKLIELQNTLEREFKPKRDELNTMRTQYESLRKQLESNPTAADAQQKADKAEQLSRSINTRSQDLEVQYNRRYQALLTPLQSKMQVLLKQWCAQKGFIAVIDVSKNTDGVIAWIDETSLNSFTTDLIRHLNATL